MQSFLSSFFGITFSYCCVDTRSLQSHVVEPCVFQPALSDVTSPDAASLGSLSDDSGPYPLSSPTSPRHPGPLSPRDDSPGVAARAGGTGSLPKQHFVPSPRNTGLLPLTPNGSQPGPVSSSTTTSPSNQDSRPAFSFVAIQGPPPPGYQSHSDSRRASSPTPPKASSFAFIPQHPHAPSPTHSSAGQSSSSVAEMRPNSVSPDARSPGQQSTPALISPATTPSFPSSAPSSHASPYLFIEDVHAKPPLVPNRESPVRSFLRCLCSLLLHGADRWQIARKKQISVS